MDQDLDLAVHYGPQPVVDTATDADEAERPAAAAHACTCSTDALGVIFSFLPLLDVASSAAACRRWFDAIAAASVGRHPIVVSVHALRALATSPLRRLVGEIDLSSSQLVAANRVESLWTAFPHLTSLTCTLHWQLLTEDTTLQFPATLHALDVTLLGFDSTGQWSHLDVLLSLVVRCPLRRLRVAMRTDALPVRTLERLRALRDSLTDLEFDWQRMRHLVSFWESGHITVLRSLNHLTRLDISNGRWTLEKLAMLTAEPVALPHLRSLDLEHTQLDPSTCSALALLPSLSVLRIRSISQPAASLVQMTKAKVDTIAVTNQIGTDSMIELVHALSRCTSITDLTLDNLRDFPPAGSSTLLPALVRLRRLQIRDTPIDIADLPASCLTMRTLEYVDITAPQTLRSLVSLRCLLHPRSVRIMVDLNSEPVELAEEDRETIFLPSLEHLALRTDGVSGVTVDLSRIFGRLPALSRFDMRSALSDLQDVFAPLLVRLPTVTRLSLMGRALPVEELGRVLSSMPHLRELELCSEHHRDGLSFLTGSPSLARTLERLAILRGIRPMVATPRDLLQLRSLTVLRYLTLKTQLVSSPPPTSTDSESACGSESAIADDQPMLSSLRELQITFAAPPHCDERPEGELPTPPFFDLALLGPMPELRTAHISCNHTPMVRVDSFADALAHCTRLTELKLHHPVLTDAHLISSLRPLTRLRSLRVESCTLSGLSFASRVRHLADTLETISANQWGPDAVCHVGDLHHLRALSNLHTLSLHLHMCDRETDATAEFDIDQSTARRDTWPQLHSSSVTLRREAMTTGRACNGACLRTERT